MKTMLFLSTALAGSALATASAGAATLLFELSGSRNATFQLDMNPTPTDFTALQTNFRNVSGVFGGSPGTARLINFSVARAIASLNIVGTPLGFTQFASGPILFSGPTSAPVFNLGTFDLTSLVSGRSTLTISEIPSAIPEPGTWMMLVGGLGLLGIALHRRREDTLQDG